MASSCLSDLSLLQCLLGQSGLTNWLKWILSFSKMGSYLSLSDLLLVRGVRNKACIPDTNW